MFAPGGSALRLYLPSTRAGWKREHAESGHESLLISPGPIIISIEGPIRLGVRSVHHTSNIVAVEIRRKVEERASGGQQRPRRGGKRRDRDYTNHCDEGQQSSAQPTHIRDMSRNRVVIPLDLLRDCRR
jgi:hypothetical protein